MGTFTFFYSCVCGSPSCELTGRLLIGFQRCCDKCDDVDVWQDHRH